MSDKMPTAPTNNDSHSKLRSSKTTAITPLPKMLLLFAFVLFCTAFTNCTAARIGNGPNIGHNIGPQIGHSTSSDADRETEKQPVHNPQPLLDKAEGLADTCNEIAKHDKDFAFYCTTVNQALIEGKSTTKVISKMDLKHLTTLATMENARHPNLNLIHADSDRPEALVNSIKEAAKTMKTGTVRFLLSVLPQNGHYAFVEALIDDCGTSVMIMDPVFGMAFLNPFKRAMVQEGYKVSTVLPRIQFSEWDCMMFSLNFAIKSFKTGFGAKINSLPQPVAYTQDDKDKIPADFFKHSQTRAVGGHGDTVVGKGQTLANRIKEYRSIRTNLDDEVSTSIEGFRIQEIIRTAAAYARGPKGFESLQNLYARIGAAQPEPKKKSKLRSTVQAITGALGKLKPRRSNRP